MGTVKCLYMSEMEETCSRNRIHLVAYKFKLQHNAMCCRRGMGQHVVPLLNGGR